MRIAFIGSQQPSEAQQAAVERAIGWVKEKHPQASVVALCHRGVGELALETAHAAGLRAVGIAPLKAYSEVQKVCNEVESLYDVEPQRAAEAEESVSRYSPAPQDLTRDGFCFHASQYLAVNNASLVIAFPGKEDETATEQGIRIALAMRTTTWCLDVDGNKVDPAGFVKVRTAPAEQGALTFICDACDWSIDTQFGEDPTTNEGLCPECGNVVRMFDEEGNQVA